MAGEPEDDELIQSNEATEQSEAENREKQGSEEAGEEANEELEITFGDEAAPASGERDTDLVRHLRHELRERDKRLAELSKAQPQAIEVGDKPTIATCEYDEERYEEELEQWRERKAQAEQSQTAQQQAAMQSQEQWQKELQAHADKRAALKFPDAAEAEETATAALSEVQQAVIVKVADNSAQVLYALGKHPAKLAELSKITDPLKLAAAVARLEGVLKVMPKRKPPEPEEIASGSASVKHGSGKQLERLEAEAERTRDRTKLIAYRKKLATAA